MSLRAARGHAGAPPSAARRAAAVPRLATLVTVAALFWATPAVTAGADPGAPGNDGDDAPTAPTDDAPAAPAARAPDGGSDREAPHAATETVTVSAEADRATADPAAFSTVIRAADYADRLTTLPDLLRDVVGVQVRSLGGEFATVSIRGSSAEQVAVYLDGVPLNRALGGAVNLADIPLVQLESIEIYRGSTPASLSLATIGGAILLHSRAPGAGPQSEASVSYGSFDTAEIAGSCARSEGRFDWLAGIDLARSAGDFRFYDDNGTEFETADDSWAHRVNNGFTRGHALLRGGLDAGSARWTFVADLMARDQGVPGVGALQAENSRLGTRRALLSAGAEAPGLAGGRLLLRGSLQHSIYEEAFDGSPDDQGVYPRRTDNTMQSTGVETGGTIVLSARQALSFLTALRLETADLKDLDLDPSDRGSATRQVGAATLEDQISLAAGRLLVNPSLRHERYASRFTPGPAPGVVPAGDAADGATTGKIGFVARIGDGLEARANGGTFLRLPDLTELYGDQGTIVGNPGLLPERGTNVDLGLVWRLARPRSGLRQARVEGALFETRAENLILYVPIAQSTVMATNANRVLIRGVEVSLSFVAGRFSGTLNAVHQRAVDQGELHAGNLLPGRPSDEVSAGAGLAAGRGRIAWAFTYVGSNYVDAANTESVRLPPRYLHDVSWRVPLPRGLEATLQVHNLFDDHTVDVARFPLPGRSLEARLSWSR